MAKAHEWTRFDDTEPEDARFCNRCEMCTCHDNVDMDSCDG